MVGIIPKPTKKLPGWYNLAFYVSLALLIAVVLGYAILIYLESKSLGTLQDLEEQLLEVGTWEDRVLEAEVLSDNKKINDFSQLFQDHKKSSNLLKFLEETCHPKVWFSKLSLNPDDAQVIISGKTANFQILGQQLFIFQEQDLVKEVNLANLSLGKEGETEFTLSLSLDPQIFK